MWDSREQTESSRKSLVLEVILRLCIVAVFLLLRYYWSPFERDFTVEQLLNKHMKPCHSSIVPFWLVGIMVIFIPLLVFSTSQSSIYEIEDAVLAWTLSITSNIVITEVFKLWFGRLRPDFLHRCFPDGIVNENLTCTGNVKDIIEGRKSFPSGHSSVAFSSLGFLSIWMFGQLNESPESECETYELWKQKLTCLLPLLLASLVAASRNLDNHHYWTDIFGGSFLGFGIALLSYHLYYYNQVLET